MQAIKKKIEERFNKGFPKKKSKWYCQNLLFKLNQCDFFFLLWLIKIVIHNVNLSNTKLIIHSTKFKNISLKQKYYNSFN